MSLYSIIGRGVRITTWQRLSQDVAGIMLVVFTPYLVSVLYGAAGMGGDSSYYYLLSLKYLSSIVVVAMLAVLLRRFYLAGTRIRNTSP